MLFKDAGEHRDAHIMDALLTCCSMILSGYFGWCIGEGKFPLNWVLAAFCGGCAFLVSMWFKKAARYRSRGYAQRGRRCLQAGFMCLAANILFDFASAAVLRDQVATQTVNANTVATNRESNLKLIDDEIGSIKGQLAWKTPYAAAETYEAEIANLTGAADIMKRSKDCTDQTRPDTKAHCQQIAKARGELAGVRQKKLLDARLAELGKMREAALVASENNQHKSNSAAAVIRMVGALALQKDTLSEMEAFWVGLSMMLLSTALLNGSLYYLATEIGEPVHSDEDVSFLAPRLDGPADAKEPIPLKATDPRTNLVVINGNEQKDSTATDALIARAMAALEKYEGSPFARQEGKA